MQSVKHAYNGRETERGRGRHTEGIFGDTAHRTTSSVRRLVNKRALDGAAFFSAAGGSSEATNGRGSARRHGRHFCRIKFRCVARSRQRLAK